MSEFTVPNISIAGAPKFTVPNISIAGAPNIDWRFSGSLGLAEVAGVRADAERANDESAFLQIRDAAGKLLADVLVHKLPSDESITVSVMNVGSALLWSHLRWLEANGGSTTTPTGEG